MSHFIARRMPGRKNARSALNLSSTRFAIALACLVGLGVVGLAGGASAEQVRESHYVMGTLLELTVEAPSRELGQRWVRDAVAVGRRYDRELTSWKPNSNLWQLNLEAGRGPQSVTDGLYEILVLSAQLSKDTGGRFDVTVGAVMGPPVPIPGLERPADIKARRACVDARDVHVLEKKQIALAQRCTLLDFGGIGKGFAAERMASVLRDYGVVDGVVNFGHSSIVVIGPSKAETSAAPIDLHLAGRVVGSVALRDHVISTSESLHGDVADEEKTPHIVDPRTGEFVREPRLAIVLASDAAVAEGWSTAIVVEPDAAIALVEKHEDLEAMVFDGDRVLRSSGFVAASGWEAVEP